MKKMLFPLTLTIFFLVSGTTVSYATTYTSLLVSDGKGGLTESQTYSVVKGDTLYNISKMHDVSLEDLMSWNNLHSDLIFPEQELVISSELATIVTTASVKPSDSSTATLKKPVSNVIAKTPIAKTETPKTPSRSSTDNVVKEFTVEATAYTAYCEGCSGITKTGINLRANPELKVIAVDPTVIELGTKVYVEGYGYAVAGDIGSAIKGNRIDVFIPTTSEAFKWGRKNVKITILE
jgi:3D (Asp-Asp-Asp) domain-containing protein